jgi:arylsulfatase A-like enzyme
MAHETDWSATFLDLAGLAPAAGLDGISLWPSLTDLRAVTPLSNATDVGATAVPAGRVHRTEVLVADHILRQGDWKYMAGAGDESPVHAFLKDCMLATGGGWLAPPSNASDNRNLCPVDIYTHSPKKGSKVRNQK